MPGERGGKKWLRRGRQKKRACARDESKHGAMVPTTVLRRHKGESPRQGSTGCSGQSGDLQRERGRQLEVSRSKELINKALRVRGGVLSGSGIPTK